MTDANRPKLFRRLGHAISRAPLLPDPMLPNPILPTPSTLRARVPHWVAAHPEPWPRVEHIVEPVWVLELDPAD